MSMTSDFMGERTERCLFVGGPDHLTERTISRDCTYFEVAETPARYQYAIRHRDQYTPPVEQMTCKLYVYRKTHKTQSGLMIMEYQP